MAGGKMQMFSALGDMATGAMDKSQGDLVAMLNYIQQLKGAAWKQEYARLWAQRRRMRAAGVPGSESMSAVPNVNDVNRQAMSEIPIIGNFLAALVGNKPTPTPRQPGGSL